jgi:hypothetical protein
MTPTEQALSQLLNSAVTARLLEALPMFGRVVAQHHDEPHLVLDEMKKLQSLLDWNEEKSKTLAAALIKEMEHG